MLYYPANLKSTVEQLREDWPVDLIQKYVNYYNKRERKVASGRTAYNDSCKTKTYKAEWVFEAVMSDSFKYFKTEKQAIAYVQRITKSKLWKDLTGGKQISVNFMNSNRLAGCARGNSISLSRNGGMNSYVILHELTHCAGHMHHDVSFRQTLLKMVSRFIGREAAKVLKGQFRAQGLKMSIRSNIQTPNEWLISYEKMTRIRQKIAA